MLAATSLGQPSSTGPREPPDKTTSLLDIYEDFFELHRICLFIHSSTLFFLVVISWLHAEWPTNVYVSQWINLITVVKDMYICQNTKVPYCLLNLFYLDGKGTCLSSISYLLLFYWKFNVTVSPSFNAWWRKTAVLRSFSWRVKLTVYVLRTYKNKI